MAHAASLAETPGGAIDFDELHRRVDDGDTSCVLLNVLPRAAFEAGRIPFSVNLPLAEIAEHVRNFLPALDQETVVYCASPSCILAPGGCTAELKSIAPTAQELRERGAACYAASLDAPDVNRAFAEWIGSAVPILTSAATWPRLRRDR